MQYQRTLSALVALGAVLVACGSDTSSSDTIASTVSIETSTTATGTTGVADTSETATSDASDTTEMSTGSRLDKAKEALQSGDFTTMLQLLQLSGIANDIEDKQITILAPTEAAFSDLSADDLQNLLTNPSQIDDVLKRHLLDEVLTYDELAAKTEVTTMSGDTLVVSNENGEVTVDGAVVTEPDRDSMTGEDGQDVAVFAIDRVLLVDS